MKNMIAMAAALGGMATGVSAQVSDDVVKIGILNDQSGVYADFGGLASVEAAKMAIDDFGGTVLGQPIELVSADHQNKADIASNIARQWYDVENVDAIMELTASSVALAVQALSTDKDKITMTTGAATTELTGAQCAPNGFHWAYDTHALAVGTGGALVEQGGDSWFFLTADYAFGYSLEEQTSEFVIANGGSVAGSVRHPLSTTDYSSFLLQAQASGAKVVGLANAGQDTQNAIKQAAEFGIVQFGPAARRAAVHAGGGSRARRRGGAGPDADGELLLEPDAGDGRVRQTLLRAQGLHAQYEPCRHLFGGAPVPQGGRSGGNGCD